MQRNGEFSLRAFFGHHKCATGWIDTILREICLHMGIHFKIVHLPENFQKEGTLGALVRLQRVDFLAYTNANRDYLEDLPLYRGFHVVRDPRDIVVSAYFSHLKSLRAEDWPVLETLRNDLKQRSKEEGLFYEMEYLRQEFEEMYNWDYEQEQVLELKMEDLTADPEQVFLRVARFLDILDESEYSGAREVIRTATMRMNRLNHKGRQFMPGGIPMFPVPRRRMHTIPASMIRAITEKKSFSRLAGGRRRGEEDVGSHYRKGVPGDWKNHFNEEHRDFFKREYNDLLMKLGYETHPDW